MLAPFYLHRLFLVPIASDDECQVFDTDPCENLFVFQLKPDGCSNILTSNHANGFVLFLRMFQDKCNRDRNRDYFHAMVTDQTVILFVRYRNDAYGK